MEALRIVGSRPLEGTVAISGAKNAALPILAATLLTDAPVTVRNVPDLSDVRTLVEVLDHLGVDAPLPTASVPMVSRSGCNPRAAADLHIRVIDPACCRAPRRSVERMRAAFCVLGPLLARRGKAIVPLPGGCRIGSRPVDLHLRALSALGATIELRDGCVYARAGRLIGTTIDLAGPCGPTVTGTANTMMAATLARGVTVLEHAAREPEIVDLGQFLISLGARIHGLGTSTIRIEGVRELGGSDYSILPDRIEAATFLLAAAITRGHIAVTGVVSSHLRAVTNALLQCGAEVAIHGDRIAVAMNDCPRAIRISARPYPGLPTDVQAQFTSLLSIARGRSLVRDCVFPDRFAHLAELRRMGARVSVLSTRTVRPFGCARIEGVERLRGAMVRARDLRASAALVLAGLAAGGETLVTHLHHLDRGYSHFAEKLTSLGANIERVNLGADDAKKSPTRRDGLARAA